MRHQQQIVNYVPQPLCECGKVWPCIEAFGGYPAPLETFECEFCGYQHDDRYGCPNCHGEGLE